MSAWLHIRRGDAPLVVSFPHSGTDIPDGIEAHLVSPWLSRKDTDFWVPQLYDFAESLGASTLRTSISRTVIDTNRDPSGASLYPNQATTDLCPLSTFDGEPLYQPNRAPDAIEIATRRAHFFDPYHAALTAELKRLRAAHGHVVLYDAHSIRSRVPRLFEDLLPNFNIGTDGGKTCDPALTQAIEKVCSESNFSRVTNGRFRGGWITRHYGQPARGIHSVQMELACRGYMHEPDPPLSADNWPQAYNAERAAPMRAALQRILETCIDFTLSPTRSTS